MQCFEKASLFASGKSLDALFVTSLIYEEITNVGVIWNIFATYFYDNLLYQLQNWLNIPYNILIHIIIMVYLFLKNC